MSLARLLQLSAAGAALLTALPTHAGQTHLLYLGGGGEPAGATTIFDSTLHAMGRFLATTNWKYEASFDGGHSTTEAVLAQFPKDRGKTEPFTAKSYKTIVQKHLSDLRTGKFQSGDQLLVVVDSHGGERGARKMRTHTVTAGSTQTLDRNSLEGGATSVSLDELGDLAKAAKEKGVRLAIVDLSCHSGSTLALADANTCVISSTSSRHYGYTRFAEQFISGLKQGQSLEEHFLRVRLADNLPALPQISSPAGRRIAAELHERLSPFLYYTSRTSGADKLTPYLRANMSEDTCEREAKQDELQVKLLELEQPDTDGFAQLRGAIDQYQAKQEELFATLRSWGSLAVGRKERLTATVRYGKKGRKATFKLDVDGVFLAQSKPDVTIRYLKDRLAEERYPDLRADLKAALQVWDKIRVRRQKLLEKYPRLAQFDADLAKLTEGEKETFKLAARVSTEERKVYQSLYPRYSQEHAREANPCRDFIL